MKKLAIIGSFPLFILVARFVPFQRLPSPCAFWYVSHLPCPTCGMTRSVVALSHLDLVRATAMNAMGPVLLFIFALWWVNGIYQIATGRRTRLGEWCGRYSIYLVLGTLAAIVVFGVLRIWWLLHHAESFR